MKTEPVARTLAAILDELANGMEVRSGGGPFVLNTGDIGLLRSLGKLSAQDASRSTNGGATIAAHALHLRYGLSLMNRWAREGGNPFADARWDEAWKVSSVDAQTWTEIQRGLADELREWSKTLASPREVSDVELGGMVGSIAHLAYHLGAIRQIHRETRGPKEGTFP
jgi:hypothetical protein